jgi:formate-dependent phosphoribosylglycinamide formyltransferase (GAR transformylase)
MQKYMVRLHGHGIRLKIDRQIAVGFYVNRFVEAPSAEEARRLAISMIWELPRLRAVLSKQNPNTLVVEVEDTTLLDDDIEMPSGQQGLVFYPDQNQK